MNLKKYLTPKAKRSTCQFNLLPEIPDLVEKGRKKLNVTKGKFVEIAIQKLCDDLKVEK